MRTIRLTGFGFCVLLPVCLQLDCIRKTAGAKSTYQILEGLLQGMEFRPSHNLFQ